jgi:hypothetical protein
MDEIKKWINEDVSLIKECNLCKESPMNVGDKTDYGAVIVYKKGDWFATLSPKTGGDVEEDFSIQLMPLAHLTHFCQVSEYPGLAENYGIAFAKISQAMSKIMAMENKDFKISAETRGDSISVATYGKCTNWKEKKEHLHIKIFPFRGDLGQPSTVDSSFGRKEIHKDKDGEFIKMKPVKKVRIDKERFDYLCKKLIELLK